MGNAEYMGFSFDPMADRNKSDSKGLAIPGREGEYLDPRTLSTTPGGSIYGTTPGGTKIMYTRDALLFLGSSPICKTPPSGMAHIPGINAPGKIETVRSPLHSPIAHLSDLTHLCYLRALA